MAIVSSSKHFSEKELRCSRTGACCMEERFMDKLEELRVLYGKPMILSSGFRHYTHYLEAKKVSPRTSDHSTGTGVDVACSRDDAYRIEQLAFELGFNRIGRKQHGDYSGRFIHLGYNYKPRAIWSYP